MLFIFEDFQLDSDAFELFRQGQPVVVQSKVLETLLYLIEHRHRIVSKDELIEGPWRGVAVGEAALNQAVMQARKAIDDDGHRQRFIRTVRGKGFRFVGDVETRPGESTAPAAEAAPPSEPQGLVGRGEELRELSQACVDAGAGRGGVRLVMGEPGIGKTRLVEQLARDVRRDATVVWGSCREGGGAPAFWLWIQVVRDLMSGAARGAENHLPRDVVADLESLLPSDRGAARSGASRFRLFDAVTTLLVRTSEKTPILVILEDLHAADMPSLRLLEFAAAPLRRSRALVVGTYRETEARRHPERWSALFDVPVAGPTVQLRGLERMDVGRLANRIGGRACSPALVDRIRGVTEGNPLFVEELVRALVFEGRELSSDAGQLAKLKLPDRVAEAIRRRVAHLPAETIELLSIGSVLGRELDVELVAALSNRKAEEVLQTLGPALDDRVLVETEVPGRLRFSHVLMRETLYEQLPHARRTELHFNAANVLEDRTQHGADPPFALLAHHYFCAAPLGGAEPAVRHAELAATRALRLAAYEEAAEHLSLADRALDRASGDAPTRGRILIALGHAHRLAGASDRAFEAFSRAADIARTANLPALVAHAALGHGDTSRESGVVDERLIALLTEALDLLDDRPSRLCARVMARLAAALYFRGPAGRRQGDALSRQAVEMARERGDPRTLVPTLVARHFVCWGSASPEEELALVEELLAIIGDNPRLIGAAQEARLWRISDCLELGREAEVRRTIAVHAQHTTVSKTPLDQSWVARLAALEALIAGRFEEALARSQESFELGKKAQDPNAEPFEIGYRAEVAMLRNRPDELSRVAPDVARMAAVSPLPVWRASEAKVAFQLGDTSRPRSVLAAIVDESLESLGGDHTRFAAFARLAEVAVGLADRDRAGRLYAELLPHIRRFVVSGSAAVFHGPVAYYAGRLAELLGKAADARAHYELALTSSRSLGARPFVARTAWALGRLVQSEDSSRAANWRDEAEVLAAGLQIPLEA